MAAGFLIVVFFWIVTVPFCRHWSHPVHFVFAPFAILNLLALVFGGFDVPDAFSGNLVNLCLFSMVCLGAISASTLKPFGITSSSYVLRDYKVTGLFLFGLLVILCLLVGYYFTEIYGNAAAYFLTIRSDVMLGNKVYPPYFMLITPLAYWYLSSIALVRQSHLWILLLVIAMLLAFDIAKTDRSTLKPLSMLFISLAVVSIDSVRRYIPILMIFTFFIVLIGLIRHEPSDSSDTLGMSILWHFYTDTVGNLYSYYQSINSPFDCGIGVAVPWLSTIDNVSCGREAFFSDIGTFFNTYPGHSYIFSAFGFSGVLIFGFIVGAFSSLLFNRRFGSIADFSRFSLAIMANLWLFRGLVHTSTGFMLVLALTFIAQRFLWKVNK